MKKLITGWKAVSVAYIVLASATAWPQGMFSGLFGGRNDEAPAQQPPPGQAPGQPGVASDPNQGLRPQATPTKEQIKEGAAKLSKQVSFEAIPTKLFDQYAGTWNGHFYTYGPSGKAEGRQAVRIQAEKQRDGSLEVKAMYFDKLAQQFVLGESYTYRKIDSTTIKVTIKRASNQTATQTGHYNDGSLFLQGDIKDGLECYRERIDGKRWLMDGFSVYNTKKASDVHHHVARLVRD